ncbi:MAG: helix-turn-helix transcriptional regulator [Spirochaetaceae bacterium]|nr:helix-turn-helix transcriptional regulator [Spirochaetaceae bacterium]
MTSIIFKKPVLDLEATGKNIKSLRTCAGISIKTMQALFSFPYPQSIYNWESGKNMPTIDNLIVLSELFGVPIEKIVVTRMVEIPVECGCPAKLLSA